MRDKLKTKKYFEEYIDAERQERTEFVDLINEALTQPEAEDDESIMEEKSSVLDNSIHILVAQYSLGKNFNELRNTFNETMPYMSSGWTAEGGYISMLWMLSIGLLINVDDKMFGNLVKLVDDEKMKDYLIDYIISSRIKTRKIAPSLIFEDPYAKVAEITKMCKVEAEKNLKLYLERYWYKGHSDSYWHGSHKSAQDTYFGYWSFESGAIAKIMGLDDASFKDNAYYPYDLVHMQ